MLKLANQDQQPHVHFWNDDRTSSLSRQDVAQRIVNDAPPDSFQASIGVDLLQWTSGRKEGTSASTSRLVDVSDVVRPMNLHADLLANLTVDGGRRYYGVPVNIHRLNLIYYYQESQGSTGDGSQAYPLCSYGTQSVMLPATIKCNTSSPDCMQPRLAVALDFGVQQLVFENILPAVGGASLYEALFRDGSLVNEHVERLRNVLRCVESLGKHVTIVQVDAWLDALNMVRNAKKGDDGADFTIAGDWANGELIEESDKAVKPLPFPSALDERIFVFTSDVFPLPSGAPHPDEAKEFLRALAKQRVQRDFSLAKGSIPAIAAKKDDADFGAAYAEFENSTKRLLGTSGLLPPKYPSDVFNRLGEQLKALLTGDTQDVEPALASFLEVSHTIQEWRKSFTPQR